MEADSELVIDAQAPLACAVALEPFQAIAGWSEQLFDRSHAVDLPQFAESHPLQRGKTRAALTVKEPLGIFVGKGTDHA